MATVSAKYLSQINKDDAPVFSEDAILLERGLCGVSRDLVY